MFSPRTRPLPLDRERLLGIRLSLNSPVVATPELPTGPARAAIVSHLEGGLRRLVVAVRSLRNGASVLYELEGEDLESTIDFSVSLDAALSFAETMGFLFDDDELGKHGDDAMERALTSWRELVAAPGVVGRSDAAPADPAAPPAEPPPAPTPRSPAPDPGPAAELLLDDLIEDQQPRPGAPEPARPAVALTKFRERTGSEAADASATELGRVRLVRRVQKSSAARVNPLLRLLTWF